MNVQARVSADFPADRELVLERIFDAPREKVYRAWTEPRLLKQWFVPRPWTISGVSLDVRPGGSSLIVMRDPDGNDYPNPGIYLEVVENERLVFTDAFTSAWQPSEKPFMTAIITFEDASDGKGGTTRYTARARHWTADDRKEHEKMGFHEGWGQCADQLAELLKTI
ncbi:MAG: SRPBCC family protein [Pseudomonadota bacterium]|nr:SRPBCC family protein [Pseudomonadota bacterium]